MAKAKPTTHSAPLRNASIGGMLKALRTKAGLSQEQLAAKAGVTRVTLSKYEGGNVTKVEELRAILGALGHPLDSLFAALVNEAASSNPDAAMVRDNQAAYSNEEARAVRAQEQLLQFVQLVGTSFSLRNELLAHLLNCATVFALERGLLHRSDA